jgi:hypothetical protein
MSSHRTRLSRRLTGREAEQLIGGQPAPPDRRALSRLLAAASSPTRPGELAGERAAVDGFTRVYRSAAPHRRPGPRVPGRTLARVTVGAAAVLVVGATFAAEAGRLPDSAQQSVHDLFAPFGVPGPAAHPSPTPAGPVRSPAGHSGGGPDIGSSGASTPVPPGGPASSAAGMRPPVTPPATADLPTMCRTYLEQLKHDPEPDPALREQLAVAAGGVDNVVQFCQTLLKSDNRHPHDHGPPGH